MIDHPKAAQAHTFQDQTSRRVSFILTTRNRAEFIGKILDTARQLVGPEDELIVVDGASTDGTAEIVASYGDLVNIFISEPDANPGHALNKGMLVARGKYIKQLTDDDEYFPEAMEQAIEVLEANPEVDLLLCGGMRQQGDKLSLVYVPPGANYGSSPEDVFRYGACGCGVVIRRKSLSQIGLFDHLNIAADGEHIARAIRNKANVKFCRINLFHHPIYDHSAIIKSGQEHQRDIERVVRQYCAPGFYWRYRLRRMIGKVVRRYAVLRLPVLGARDALGRVVRILRSKGRPKGSDQDAPIWDGGFS